MQNKKIKKLKDMDLGKNMFIKLEMELQRL